MLDWAYGTPGLMAGHVLGWRLQVLPQEELVSAALLELVGISWIAQRSKNQRPPTLVELLRSRDLGLPQPGIVCMKGLP